MVGVKCTTQLGMNSTGLKTFFSYFDPSCVQSLAINTPKWWRISQKLAGWQLSEKLHSCNSSDNHRRHPKMKHLHKFSPEINMLCPHPPLANSFLAPKSYLNSPVMLSSTNCKPRAVVGEVHQQWSRGGQGQPVEGREAIDNFSCTAGPDADNETSKF